MVEHPRLLNALCRSFEKPCFFFFFRLRLDDFTTGVDDRAVPFARCEPNSSRFSFEHGQESPGEGPVVPAPGVVSGHGSLVRLKLVA